jgi:hypothetical protein
MNSLRISALQGELTPHSLASCAPHGTFNATVEAVLEDIAESEDVPLDKLRGWLVRQTTQPSSPHPRSPVRRASPSWTGPLSPRKSGSSLTDRSHSGRFDCTTSSSSTTLRRDQSGNTRTVRGGASPCAPAQQGPGPFLPTGNDEVIRAFGHDECVEGAPRHVKKTVSWRTLQSGAPPRGAHSKGQWSGRWRAQGGDCGSAEDARW